jgi:hypothetical protein
MKCPLCGSSLTTRFTVTWKQTLFIWNSDLVYGHYLICRKQPAGACSYAVEIDQIPGLEKVLIKGTEQMLDAFEREGEG